MQYLGESSEFLDAILTTEVKAALKDCERLVSVMHFTDHPFDTEL